MGNPGPDARERKAAELRERQAAAAAAWAREVAGRVVVVGSRANRDKDAVWAALDRLASRREVLKIVHTGQRGTAAWAREWAEARGVRHEAVLAEFTREGVYDLRTRNLAITMDPGAGGAVVFDCQGDPEAADLADACEAAGVPVWRPYG